MDAESLASAEFVLTNAPGWLAYLFVVLAAGLGWWAFRRYGPNPGGIPGMIARGCRIAALVVLVALLAGPALQRTEVTTERGNLVIAVDRSASMDRSDGPDEARRVAVATALRSGIEGLQETRSLQVSWYAVGNGITPLDPSELEDLPVEAPRSVVGEDLAQLAFQTRADALVVVSDGRVTSGSSLAATAERLARHELPAHGVWILGTGTDRIDPELRIDEVVAPRQAPLGEQVPVQVRLSGRQLGDEPIAVVVTRDGEEVARIEVDAPTAEEDDPLADRNIETEVEVIFPDKGEQRLQVEVVQGGLRDTAGAAVTVVDRKLQVLMLAHRPRYEMRYLRVALSRDDTVTLHSYLADGRWRRWGDQLYGPAEKPFTAAALADYDAIIIGDIGAQAFRVEQLDAIADHVRENGAGVVWVPGGRGAVTSYRGTRLGNLLPVRLGDAATVMRGYSDNVERRLQPSQRAEALNLLTIDRQDWAELPLLRSAAPVVEVVAGADVLAVDARSGGEQPLVVVRDFDAGRALFVATDDTWRWRRNVGDRYLHRFWSQLLRYVSTGRTHGDQRWRVVVTPPLATPGQPVQLGIVPTGAVGDLAALPEHATLELLGVAEDDREMQRVHRADGQRSFLGTVPAPAPGAWTVGAIDGLTAEEVIPGELQVLPPRDELRDPRIDAAALETLATETGGKLVLVNAAAEAGADPVAALLDQLPTLSRQQPSTQREAVWDEWWALILLLVLLSTEWALRRWFRLP